MIEQTSPVAGGRQLPPTPTDVEASRVEQTRREVDRLCWTGILLGLAFTMTNVQTFAAAGAAPWSLPWLTAWLLDPMVSLVLIAVLRAEQVTARHRVRTGPWVRVAKWFTLAATYAMNTWGAFAVGAPAMVVLHSVPPLVVFVAAEAVTDLRDKLTVTAAVVNTPGTPAPALEPTPQRTHSTARRKFFAEYLAEARAAWRPGVDVTPAWVREVTSCSRGLSSRLAAALVAEQTGRAER
jgi:hypothetical protein